MPRLDAESVFVAVVGLMFAAVPSALAAAEYISVPGWVSPEFSGCCATDEPEEFWVCSDENRYNIRRIDYTTGSNTAVLSFGEHNDLESLAADGTGGCFMVTSQSKNSANRTLLSHLTADGTCTTVANLKGILTTEYPFLVPYAAIDGNVGGMSIEGLAYDSIDDRLWFGFRCPLVCPTNMAQNGSSAIILRLDNALTNWSPTNTTNFVWASQPRLLRLGGLGIRDMYYGGSNTMYILAGRAVGEGDCHLIGYDLLSDKITFCQIVPRVDSDDEGNPGISEAEGITQITLGGQKKMLVVYDSAFKGVYKALDFPDPAADIYNVNGVADWIDALQDDPDADGDGISDGWEVVAGTSVTNPVDRFHISAISLGASSNEVVVSWSSATNRQYNLLMCTNLIAPSWDPITNNVVATEPVNVHTATVFGSEAFFKAELLP